MKLVAIAVLAACATTSPRHTVAIAHRGGPIAAAPCEIAGVLRDVATGEPVVAATLWVEDGPVAITDERGAFALAIRGRGATLHVYYASADLKRQLQDLRCDAPLVLPVTYGPRYFHGCELDSDLVWAN